DSTVNQELHGPRRLAYGEVDVFDLHVFLELEHQGGPLLSGQALDEGPYATNLVPVRREVVERRTGYRQIMEIVQGLRRTEGAVAVGDSVNRDLIQPGSKRPPRHL